MFHGVASDIPLPLFPGPVVVIATARLAPTF